jgi:arylsulfatase
MKEETNELRGAPITCVIVSIVVASHANGQPTKPNILVIWGDDIGQSNISACSRGLMGYKTPNIDRIANKGILFTDYYAEQGCTVFRTGLSKVGLPGATIGLSDKDPTIAELLKGQGYATGQFGKNHLGDRNEFLPTVYGFDEFYGNLYHVNAEEEPESPQRIVIPGQPGPLRSRRPGESNKALRAVISSTCGPRH